MSNPTLTIDVLVHPVSTSKKLKAKDVLPVPTTIALKDAHVGLNGENKLCVFGEKNESGVILCFKAWEIQSFKFEQNKEARELFDIEFTPPPYILLNDSEIVKVHGTVDYEFVKEMIKGVYGMDIWNQSLPTYVLDYLDSSAYDRGHSAGHDEVLQIFKESVCEMAAFKSREK